MPGGYFCRICSSLFLYPFQELARGEPVEAQGHGRSLHRLAAQDKVGVCVNRSSGCGRYEYLFFVWEMKKHRHTPALHGIASASV
jgi:hypothetical protein